MWYTVFLHSELILENNSPWCLSQLLTGVSDSAGDFGINCLPVKKNLPSLHLGEALGSHLSNPSVLQIREYYVSCHPNQGSLNCSLWSPFILSITIDQCLPQNWHVLEAKDEGGKLGASRTINIFWHKMFKKKE